MNNDKLEYIAKMCDMSTDDTIDFALGVLYLELTKKSIGTLEKRESILERIERNL